VDIRLLDGAKEDLCNGWFFYESQALGLGDRFLDAIEADVLQLPAYAGIHLQVDGFHLMPIKRFPFALYDLIEEGSIDSDGIGPPVRCPITCQLSNSCSMARMRPGSD